jgi:hypothetical protein
VASVRRRSDIVSAQGRVSGQKQHRAKCIVDPSIHRSIDPSIERTRDALKSWWVPCRNARADTSSLCPPNDLMHVLDRVSKMCTFLSPPPTAR